jgi:crotonobetainyl-CoA:carnitine CoA-transferase CaiB-like acyl-CoA transferase
MLSPYRVIDLCDERGAFAGTVMAMLGAEVIVAEPPEGGPLRHRAPFVADRPGLDRSLVHHAFSRGKKSVVVSCREELRALVRSADVLVEPGPPSDDLLDAHPGLVHVTISAFGTTGPKAGWAATDLTVAAAGYQLGITGNADKPPLRCAVPQTWLHAGIDAAVGVLVALAQRARSGIGQRIDISAQHSWTLAGFHYPLYPAWGEPEVTRNGSHVRIGPVFSRFEYPALDGYVTYLLLFGAAVGPFTNRMVRWMVEEGACDASFADVEWSEFRADLETDRYEQLKAAVAGFLAKRTKGELFEAARRRKLLIAPVASLSEVLASPQFLARHVWRTVDLPDGLTARVPGPYVLA